MAWGATFPFHFTWHVSGHECMMLLLLSWVLLHSSPGQHFKPKLQTNGTERAAFELFQAGKQASTFTVPHAVQLIASV